MCLTQACDIQAETFNELSRKNKRNRLSSVDVRMWVDRTPENIRKYSTSEQPPIGQSRFSKTLPRRASMFHHRSNNDFVNNTQGDNIAFGKCFMEEYSHLLLLVLRQCGPTVKLIYSHCDSLEFQIK